MECPATEAVSPFGLRVSRKIIAATITIVIMPAIPSFYHQPQTIDDLVAQYVYRVLAQMGLPQDEQYRWKGKS